MARVFGLRLILKIDLPDRDARETDENTIDGWMSSQPEGSWLNYKYLEDETRDDFQFLLKATLFIAVSSRSEANTKMNQLENNLSNLSGTAYVKYDYEEKDDEFDAIIG